MKLGKKIKKFRLDNLLTMREAAEIFGVSRSEIARLEKCKHKPHFITEAKWKQKFKEIEKEEK